MRRDTLEPFFDRLLARTVLEHPVLQIGLMSLDSKNPYWVHLESLDLGNHVTWVDATAADDYDALHARISREQRETKFPNPERQPGWRAVFILHEARRFIEVFFSYAHAHADGMSGRMFHETLLRNLNSTHTADELPVLKGRSFKTNTRTNKLLPPQEKLAYWRKGLLWTAGIVAKEVRLLEFKPRITDATWAPIRVPYTGINFHTVIIPNDVLGRVLEACRGHSSTLTSLMNALILVSLSRRLSDKEAQAFECITPISTRQLLKPSSQSHDPPYDPDGTMGNLNTNTSHDFGPDIVASIRKPDGVDVIPMESLMDIIWSVSAGVRRKLQECLAMGLKNQQLSIMGFVSDWRKIHIDEIKRPRGTGWVMTNIGVIDGDPLAQEAASGPRWTIDRAMFQLSSEVSRSFFHVCPVAVKGKDLTIDISWQDGIVDGALGEGLVGDIDAMLRRIGS